MVCSGRLEKVPTGHGVGLCDAAAEDTGRQHGLAKGTPQVQGVGSQGSRCGPSLRDGAGPTMVLTVRCASANIPEGQLPCPSMTHREPSPSLVAGITSSELIPLTANENPGVTRPLTSVHTKQLEPQQTPQVYVNHALLQYPLAVGWTMHGTPFPSGLFPSAPGSSRKLRNVVIVIS